MSDELMNGYWGDPGEYSYSWPIGSLADDSGHKQGCWWDCERSAECCGGSYCALPNGATGERDPPASQCLAQRLSGAG